MNNGAMIATAGKKLIASTTESTGFRATEARSEPERKRRAIPTTRQTIVVIPAMIRLLSKPSL